MNSPSNSSALVNWFRQHGVSLLLGLGLLTGLILIAYPTVSDWWNQFHQSRAIESYAQQVEGMDPKERDEQLKDAYAYNRGLVETGARWNATSEQRAEYNSQLDFASDGMMGYVSIPAIGVKLPIYHGTGDAVLQTSIGHLEATSLPVGCESFDKATGNVEDATEGAHCVISGHRGLPSARLFTDLDKLTEGDVFTMTVMDTTYTYQVDQIRIVKPRELQDLQIEAGEDLCTLITCTPYGVNTHRLLVRGHRIGNVIDTDAVTADAVQVPRYIAVPVAAIPVLILLLLESSAYYRRERAWEEEDV